ncbi:fumarate reductase cytochrome b subunit [Pelagibaculum spongiae]|uniref:Fumarate reductase cytochrome subunit b n=1 Tax=Pelagibaculum spongiae TaxID=2080658 RepID=A0A2V1GY57_9GAMM|nr:fumarate reductase cytochrome b subunit [Pelagibaculum spongiae]PVZ67665.1 fumarate reductase cytochrome subunit b [Pelagibaculum spongiae]
MTAKLLTDAKRWSARLDVGQSLSGALLTIFLWTHLILVSSILLGGDAMDFVARNMELAFLTENGHGYPWVVTVIAIGIGALAVIHMLSALYRLPLQVKQRLALRNHLQVVQHGDTKLWVWQAVTGVVIMVLLPVHLWLIGSDPISVGAVGSATRIWIDHAWVLYIPLLLAAEIHAAIGAYRVVIKWGLVKNLDQREKLRRLKTIFSLVFISVGMLSLAAFWPHAAG